MGVPAEVVERLHDLSEAYFDAKEGRLITEALEMFIETRLAGGTGGTEAL